MAGGGAGPLVKAGSVNQAGPGLGGRPNEADLIANAGILRLMTEIGEAKIHTDRWPPSTFHTKQKDLYSNNEPVVVEAVPNAVTAGDSIVWFRKSDVVVTGEIFNQTTNDERLLRVLLSEEREVRSDRVEQNGYDRRHAAKMTRTRSTLQLF